MQRIQIRNFGPLREIDLEIKDFMVLIGPNAGGKSTIAKLVWFARRLREYLDEFSFSQQGQLQGEEFADAFQLHVSQKLEQLFSEVYFNNSAWRITCYLDNENSFFELFKSESDSNSARCSFDPEIRKKLAEFSRQLNHNQTDFAELTRRGILMRRASIPFSYKPCWCIPDNRILFSFGQSNPYHSPGGTYEQFENYVKSIRTRFEEGLEGYTWHIQRTASATETNLSEKIKLAEQARPLIDALLKGKYQHKNGVDYLYIEGVGRIPADEASSGQQAGLWAAVMPYSLLFRSEYSMVIEEPETHLYPIAQKQMTELIALAFNAQPGNQFIVTTHSPYILTVLNNLLLAWKTGQQSRKEASGIVPETCWLDPARIGAYYIGGAHEGANNAGKSISIIGESGLIGENELDDASGSIGEAFDRLIALQRNLRKQQS